MDEMPKRNSPNPKKPKLEKKFHFSIWYVLFAFLFMFAFESLLTRTQIVNIPYSKLKELIRTGKVIECTVSPDKIEGTVFTGDSTKLTELRLYEKNLRASEGPGSKKDLMKAINSANSEQKELAPFLHRFATQRVNDPDLVKELEKANINFNGKPSGSWLRTLFLGWI